MDSVTNPAFSILFQSGTARIKSEFHWAGSQQWLHGQAFGMPALEARMHWAGSKQSQYWQTLDMAASGAWVTLGRLQIGVLT
jgi:hypothetical protein